MSVKRTVFFLSISIILSSIYLQATAFDSLSIEKTGRKVVVDMPSVKTKKNERRARKVVKQLSKLCKDNEKLQLYVDFVLKQIEDDDLILVTIKDNKKNSVNDIKESVAFFINRDRSSLDIHNYIPAIVFRESFFDFLEKEPSLALSLVFHQCVIASLYHDTPLPFKAPDKRELDTYLLTMQAYYLQTQFIVLYATTHDEPLTQYESYMIQSFKNDNLASFSMSILGVQLEQVYGLYRLSSNGLSLEDSVNTFLDYGIELVVHFKSDNTMSLFEKYTELVPLYTYINYGPDLLYAIYLAKSPSVVDRNEFKIEQYSKLNGVFLRVQDVFNQNKYDFYKYKEQLGKKL